MAVALYRGAAVRRAAVDRYLLSAGKVAAVAHAGTDRQTDGHLPFHTARKKVNKLINFRTEC